VCEEDFASVKACEGDLSRSSTMAMEDVSVVLMHGAWADGSSWAGLQYSKKMTAKLFHRCREKLDARA
jgi:hypothetical protein